MSVSTVLTASDLRTGLIVFWTNQGTWSTDADQAQVAVNDAEVAALDQVIARPETQVEVVGPYLVHSDGKLVADLVPFVPKKMREQRRLQGPGSNTTSRRIAAAA